VGKERPYTASLIGLLALTIVGAGAADRHRQIAKVPDWTSVPLELAGWKGTLESFEPGYGDPAESSLLRVYRNERSEPVIVYVGFYNDLSSYLEVHSPEVCYPAQGWTVLSTMRSAEYISARRQFRPQEAVVEKNGQRRLVVWWYNAGSRPFENRIRYVYALLALSSLAGRTDGSMVRIETPLEDKNEERARQRLKDFERIFLPSLDKALP